MKIKTFSIVVGFFILSILFTLSLIFYVFFYQDIKDSNWIRVTYQIIMPIISFISIIVLYMAFIQKKYFWRIRTCIACSKLKKYINNLNYDYIVYTSGNSKRILEKCKIDLNERCLRIELTKRGNPQFNTEEKSDKTLTRKHFYELSDDFKNKTTEYLSDKNILIFDDVIKSGSTVLEIIHHLKLHVHKVIVASFASDKSFYNNNIPLYTIYEFDKIDDDYSFYWRKSKKKIKLSKKMEK